jgi:membrane protein YqaA with SNARE-associated domain
MDALLSSLLSPSGSLASLFAAAFIAATVLPLSSEAALFAVLQLHPDQLWPALVLATTGNTLGGMTTYALGRWLGTRKPLTQLERVRRWGAPATALGWVPLVGEGLCLAAGWLKLGVLPVLAWQMAGRFARYWVVAQGSL